jgi:tetratricopeptide (TPR) repeat protein
LYRQLSEEHANYLISHTSTTEESILRVYRGQAIAVGELNLIRESRGAFISFNNFLSTSTNQMMAKSFAKGATIVDGLTRVLFEFQIDTRLLGTKPYADISKVSYYQGEEEILVMLGSIFRIDQVEYDEDAQLWLAKLSLCNENDFELKDLIAQLKKDIDAGITSLGWLFYRQGQLEKAKQYFKGLLNEESLSQFDKSNCYGGLAFVTLAMNEYDEALMNYQKALELCIELGNEIYIASTYCSIGNVYCLKNNLDLALSNVQRALDIFLPLNHPQLLDVYKVMANICTSRNQLLLAIDYSQKALEVAHHYLPPNDCKIGQIYANMGFIYDKADYYTKALECYERAYYILSKSLSPGHPHISLVERWIQDTRAKMN